MDCATGRCECFDSTWFGVLSAHLKGGDADDWGACKHDQLRLLCQQAHASSEAAITVRGHCATFLCNYLYERERGKPSSQRCLPLYRAGEAGDIDALLNALRTHPSIPSTGKGVASTAAAALDSSSDEGGSDGDAVEAAAEAAAEALQTLALRQCSFAAEELAKNGFGLAFAANDEASGGMGLVVAAYIPLRSGGSPPAAHSGERLQPGDVVLKVGEEDGDLTKLLSEEGLLAALAGNAPTTYDHTLLCSSSGCLAARPVPRRSARKDEAQVWAQRGWEALSLAVTCAGR